MNGLQQIPTVLSRMESLPDAVWVEVASYTGARTVCHFAEVNNNCQRIGMDERLWKQQCRGYSHLPAVLACHDDFRGLYRRDVHTHLLSLRNESYQAKRLLLQQRLEALMPHSICPLIVQEQACMVSIGLFMGGAIGFYLALAIMMLYLSLPEVVTFMKVITDLGLMSFIVGAFCCAASVACCGVSVMLFSFDMIAVCLRRIVLLGGRFCGVYYYRMREPVEPT